MKYILVKTPSILLSMAVLLCLGCNSSSSDKSDESLDVQNDEQALAERVTYTDQEVVVDDSATKNKPYAKAADIASLTLVAQIAPPQLEGVNLQANEVIIEGSKAYIGYNVQGETFAGAIDVIDISQANKPKLISSAVFNDTDVNGLAMHDKELYLAAATSNSNYSSPAIFQRILLSGGKLSDDYLTVDLPSFAGTDVNVSAKYVYVTSGAQAGYVTVLNSGDYSLHNSVAVDDARGVAVDNSDVAIIAGTNARLFLFDNEAGVLSQEYTLTGATIPYSKSTVEIIRNKAILGLGDGGTQIVCLTDGKVLEKIEQPVLDSVDSQATVTNAVTAYKRSLFMANGEAGVYMAVAVSNFKDKDCEENALQVVGKLQLEASTSVNHITYRNDILFVASGLGGLKIIKVDD